jgi:putative spermidine/putrescine transport system ATP-binding protein
MASIECIQLVKRYGAVTAVHPLDLRVPEGAYCCLIGPSGCGKTSLLRMIAGHEAASEGDILLAGRNITALPPALRGTAMMFQNYALFPHLSVRDNVAFGLKMRGMGREERYREADAMLARVQLGSFGDRRPAQLSGGQQQRVALARALITNPGVLLLDEPLSALDPFMRGQMREELKRLQRTLGITFVHVTHAQDEALALADLVVVMEAGRIVQQGSPREVFDRPGTRFVARFMGGHSILEGEVPADGAVLELAGGGRVALPEPAPAGKAAIAVRSDRIRLDGTAGNGFAATVTAVEYQGLFVRVALQDAAGAAHALVCSEPEFDACPVVPGDAVTAGFAAADAHILTA